MFKLKFDVRRMIVSPRRVEQVLRGRRSRPATEPLSALLLLVTVCAEQRLAADDRRGPVGTIVTNGSLPVAGGVQMQLLPEGVYGISREPW